MRSSIAATVTVLAMLQFDVVKVSDVGATATCAFAMSAMITLALGGAARTTVYVSTPVLPSLTSVLPPVWVKLIPVGSQVPMGLLHVPVSASLGSQVGGVVLLLLLLL